MSRTVVLVGVTVPMSLSLLGSRLSLMADRGWEVHVAVGAPLPAMYQPDPRVCVHVIPMTRQMTPISDARSLWEWSALIKRVRPTVVVGATPKAGFLSMLAARRRGVRHRVFEAWGARWDGVPGTRGSILRAAEGLTVWCSSQTVAVSDSLADLFFEAQVAHRRPRVIGFGGTQGVDVQRFRPASEIVTEPVVGFVGRQAADKGLRDLRKVLDIVRATVPDAQLAIAGEADAADPLDEGTGAWLAGDPRNRLIGHTDDVPTFLRGVSVLCFPSHREGLPNAVLEAAATGVPVVGWDVTGVRDAVIDGSTGYLVPLGDHESMAERVIELLRDPQRRSTMGVAARSFACERFDSLLVQSAFVDFLAAS